MTLVMDLRANTDEAARVEVLRSYHILDTARSRPFDALVAQAARELGCPMAVLGFIDQERIWFKAAVGVGEQRQMPRRGTVPLERFLHEDPFAVSDLGGDREFPNHPLVHEHGVRFFAAAPLIAPSGHCLGALAVMDVRPQSPTEEQLARLRDLAAASMHQVEQRRSVLGSLRSGTPVRPHHADAIDVARMLRRRRPLEVQVVDIDARGTWIVVSGSVDSDVTDRLERELLRLAPGGRKSHQRVLLDLSRLHHFGAAAFTALLAVADRLEQGGGQLVVGRSSPAVRRALRGMDPRGRLRVIG